MNKIICINQILLGLVLYALTHSLALGGNQQCFSDPKQAYAYLINEQNNPTASDTLPININTANEAKLITLDGIGSNKAQAIILYRETMGRFNSVDDLAKVKGIGEKTVEKNRARLMVNE